LPCTGLEELPHLPKNSIGDPVNFIRVRNDRPLSWDAAVPVLGFGFVIVVLLNSLERDKSI
jgi:hypothetical protein